MMHRLPYVLVVMFAAVGGSDLSAGTQCPNDWIKTDGLPGVGGVPEVVDP